MAKLRWVILCQRVITDSDTNSVSYIDSIEELGVPALPFPFPPLVVGTLWEREQPGETIRMRVRLHPPQGNVEVPQIEATLDDARAIRHRANVTVAGPVIESEGRHYFSVDQLVDNQWKEESRVPIDIRLMEAPPALS